MLAGRSARNLASGARNGLRRLVSRRVRPLEDLTMDERRRMWPKARALPERHLRNCRLLESRERMLELLPRGAICAEVGIDKCDFSAKILAATTPAMLHLADISERSIARAGERFAREIAAGRVETHLGDSSALVGALPDGSLDWIYIDGDHFYDGVRRDLEAARTKVAEGGLIAVNDYIYFSSSDFCKYGVVEAVNEFCV